MSLTCFSCGIPTSLQVYLTLSIPTRMIQINQAPAYTRFTAATKKARFWNFIESVNCDIICGCETWLNPTIYDAEVLASNSNYNIHHKNRLVGHGGSLILMKDNIVSEPVEANTQHTDLLTIMKNIQNNYSKPSHKSATYLRTLPSGLQVTSTRPQTNC